MVKIVAGKYKGHKLSMLSHDIVRPTSGIVRKSIFDSLGIIEGKTILDLFGGIGSLSIEALSRGAKDITIVEKNRNVVKVLAKNLNTICKDDSFKIHNMDVFLFLKKINYSFDIVFADPPYSFQDYNKLRESASSILANDGIFCMETSKRTKIDGTEYKIREFGNTKIIFWRNSL